MGNHTSEVRLGSFPGLELVPLFLPCSDGERGALETWLLGPKVPPFPNRLQNIYQPIRGFFWDILHTQYRAATDVYALMFLADVVDFIIIVFGFWAFGVRNSLFFPLLLVYHSFSNSLGNLIQH